MKTPIVVIVMARSIGPMQTGLIHGPQGGDGM